MKHPIGKTKNDKDVYVDLIHSKAAAHISQQPRLATLVKEALTRITAQDTTLKLEYDMGHAIGHDFVVATTDKDTIFYARPLKDSVFTRYVKNGKPNVTQYISIVLRRDETGDYELWDTWIGQASPPRPGSPDETADSKPFWDAHAIVLTNQAVQSNSITRTRPY